MNKKALYPILVLALGLGLAVFIGVNEPTMVPEPHHSMATTVRVMQVQSHDEYLGIQSQGDELTRVGVLIGLMAFVKTAGGELAHLPVRVSP